MTTYVWPGPSWTGAIGRPQILIEKWVHQLVGLNRLELAVELQATNLHVDPVPALTASERIPQIRQEVLQEFAEFLELGALVILASVPRAK